MAYLHCHACGWEQDDFWSEGYNPIKSLADWQDSLLEKDIDGQFTDDSYFIKEHGNITLREVLAQEFEKGARRIRDMVYRTEQEFREKNPERNCPKCGKHDLDID